MAALAAAVEVFIKTLTGDVPFGAAGTVLERIKAVREVMDQLTFAMLGPLAQMEASGELLEEGGQKTLKAYLAHAWGIPHGEAKRLMELAQNLHNDTLPETAAAIEAGALTVGEAAAIASGAEREVKKRDTGENPDADVYRAKIDLGLAGMKADEPSLSVKALGDRANALGLGLNPQRPEQNEAREFAARGARLHSSFAGFTLEAWGPVSDGERLKAALESYMAPYGTTENTNADGAGADGATDGGDLGIGVVPAGEALTSRYARTYDALIAAAGFAHSHHGHGCEQPPGTKAVINVTVPLSALVAFGFAFNTDNDDKVAADAVTAGATPAGVATAGAAGAATGGITTAAGANTTGATGSTGATGATGAVIAPGPEPGPDPGGGTGVGNTGPPPQATNTTDPPHTDTGPTPGAGGAATPATGGALGTDVAVTQDGTILALSAVSAMAPTAQIRRLIFDDRTGLPLDLGRAQRLAPGYLRNAAFLRHTTCAWSGGCDVPVSQCEADHITEFSRGGTTAIANIQPLCSTHNRAKHRRNNRIPAETGGAGGTRGQSHTD